MISKLCPTTCDRIEPKTENRKLLGPTAAVQISTNTNTYTSVSGFRRFSASKRLFLRT
jgi:hypothetical protein